MRLLVSGLLLGALITAGYLREFPLWLAFWYAAISLATFGLYAWDKYRAQKEGWRVPENALHVFELFGGWPGALAAQGWLRHKNRKRKFQIIFWLIVIVHAVFWIWWLFFRV